jgi:hypothetical protein
LMTVLVVGKKGMTAPSLRIGLESVDGASHAIGPVERDARHIPTTAPLLQTLLGASVPGIVMV